MTVDNWKGKACPVCGTPILDDKLALILYFATEENKLEVAELLQELKPDMKAYHVEQLDG